MFEILMKTLNNNAISFEQLGPELHLSKLVSAIPSILKPSMHFHLIKISTTVEVQGWCDIAFHGILITF